MTQLFSYPILDVLDGIQRVAPSLLNEQERHRRYQDAAQDFRIRIIYAHLHLLCTLLDAGGVAVLLSDIRGFVFNVQVRTMMQRTAAPSRLSHASFPILSTTPLR